jgi:sugar phosphate isomerase/epimerase
MKLVVSSYSYHQRIKTGEMTQLDAVRAAKEMGFEGIEFTDLMPNPSPTLDEQLAYAKEIRAEAERQGIEIVGYMIGANLYRGTPKEDEAEVTRVCGQVDVAAELGARILRHDVCGSESVNGRFVGFERMLPTIAANARRITEYAQARGIRTCSENHGRIAQDRDRMERLYYAVDHENYGLLIDMGNFACADEDSLLAVSRLAPMAIHVHAKDFIKIPFGTPVENDKKTFLTRGANRLMGCALGDGDIPVAQCIAILKQVGYDGTVTIEFEGNGDCMTEIPRGLERLREYVK